MLSEKANSPKLHILFHLYNILKITVRDGEQFSSCHEWGKGGGCGYKKVGSTRDPWDRNVLRLDCGSGGHEYTKCTKLNTHTHK